MKATICTLSLLLALGLTAPAALIYSSDGPFNSNGGAGDGIIPDNSTIGLSDSHTASGLPASITAVLLTFQLQGGFGSDLSGYLRLGNLETSPFYDLTTILHGQPVISASTPVNFNLDVTSAFASFDPNNTWTLFLADSSAGGQTTLNEWSLDITAVPEPTTWAALIFGGLLVTFYAARSRAGQSRIRSWRTSFSRWLDAA